MDHLVVAKICRHLSARAVSDDSCRPESPSNLVPNRRRSWTERRTRPISAMLVNLTETEEITIYGSVDHIYTRSFESRLLLLLLSPLAKAGCAIARCGIQQANDIRDHGWRS